MDYQPLPALRTKLNKDVPPTVVEHLNYLWKAATFVLPSSASIPAMHRLSKSFVDIVREHKVDLPTNVTEKLCGFCSVVLIPSLTCQVRLRSRSRRSKVNRVGKEHLKNQLVRSYVHCRVLVVFSA
jgi:RNase P subunit RPR2